jgi:hypothetical protein
LRRYTKVLQPGGGDENSTTGECQPCAAGSYSPTEDTAQCTLGELGYFSPAGSGRCDTCLVRRCRLNPVEPRDASAWSQCLKLNCDELVLSFASNLCRYSPVGTYANTMGTETCTACPTNREAGADICPLSSST